MSKLSPFYLILCCIFFSCQPATDKPSNIAINISFSESASTDPLDGRLLLMLSTNNEEEPRFQIGVGLKDQLIYKRYILSCIFWVYELYLQFMK